MKIINKKKEAIKELKRISTRTNSENNNKITAIVEEILREVKNHGDKAVGKYTKKFGAWNQVKEAWYIQLLFPLVRSKDSKSELHSIITKNDYDPSTLNKKFNS